MSSRVINGRWYSNIWDSENPNQRIVVSLNAYAPEKRKAQIALGGVLKDLENGIRPVCANTKISKLKIPKGMKTRSKGIIEDHIVPFFGKCEPREINVELLEEYTQHRFGRDSNGELWAVHNTIDKEFLAFQQLLQTALGKNYKLKRPKYKKVKKKTQHPLTMNQIKTVASFIPESYIEVFWIMSLTAIEIIDALSLRPVDFQRQKEVIWLDTERHKSGEIIKVPICPFLWDKIKAYPWPILEEDIIFKKINELKYPTKSVSTAFKRAFVKAGLPKYCAKDLRRFIGSILLDQGNSKSWIATILSHVEGSAQTDCYLNIYDSTAEKEFNKISLGGLV